MKRYRLDARRFSGPLYSATRNDSEAEDADDIQFLREFGRSMLTRGFTIWLYERVLRSTDPVTCDNRPAQVYDLRLIEQRRPGERILGSALIKRQH